METAQVSLNRKMGQQTVVYPYNKILLSNKKEQITDTHNNKDALKRIILRWGKRDKNRMIQLI